MAWRKFSDGEFKVSVRGYKEALVPAARKLRKDGIKCHLLKTPTKGQPKLHTLWVKNSRDYRRVF